MPVLDEAPARCDLLLRGGTVVDGSGAPRFAADVAVTGDRIVAVGELSGTEASEEIDAGGLVVAPGFIDVHTHDDRLLISDPAVPAKASQGVTTVVVGNCGVSLAPLTLETRPPPPLDLLGDESGYRFGSFADYLDALDRSPAALNAAFLVGHTTLRVRTMPALGWLVGLLVDLS